MSWRVLETKSALKEVLKLPQRIRLIYFQLVPDLTLEGPFHYGWDAKVLKGRVKVRIRLSREYRVIIQAVEPDILVVKVAHRKEVYK